MVGAIVVGANVVGATVVGATVVGAIVVFAAVVVGMVLVGHTIGATGLALGSGTSRYSMEVVIFKLAAGPRV